MIYFFDGKTCYEPSDFLQPCCRASFAAMEHSRLDRLESFIKEQQKVSCSRFAGLIEQCQLESKWTKHPERQSSANQG